MKILKNLFDFYINSSIHVALAVVSLCIISFFHFQIPLDYFLLLFVFFGTITGYNFVKYAGIAKLHHLSLAKSLRLIQIFSLISFLALIWLAFRVDIEILIWTAIFGLLTLLYALPVFSNKRNLRSVTGLKIYVIAVVWAGVSVVLPASLGVDVKIEYVLWEFVQRFLFVLAWILPFEIRDLKYDLRQLETIPQKIGVSNTRMLGVFFILIAVGVEFIKDLSLNVSFAALIVTALTSAGFIWKSKEKQLPFYSSFWVEAIPIFWLLILIVLRSI